MQALADYFKPHRAEALSRIRSNAFAVLLIAVLSSLLPRIPALPTALAVALSGTRHRSWSADGIYALFCMLEVGAVALLSLNILQAVYAVKYPRAPIPPSPSPAKSKAIHMAPPTPQRSLRLSPNPAAPKILLLQRVGLRAPVFLIHVPLLPHLDALPRPALLHPPVILHQHLHVLHLHHHAHPQPHPLLLPWQARRRVHRASVRRRVPHRAPESPRLGRRMNEQCMISLSILMLSLSRWVLSAIIILFRSPWGDRAKTVLLRSARAIPNVSFLPAVLS
ncbi:hypothetical protein B0H17DRAFT_523982 [Mycena rosella]|uniref:Uncharacterized protein n=1 Tax=Mycena rosella TaxID=1033263 RepID=A0AAD7GXQ9_MYCRO|nr:hypothetical protein B0H17DRAFT_523982 [Mycena rosella]